MPSVTKIVGAGSVVARSGSARTWVDPGYVTADDGSYTALNGDLYWSGDYTDFLEGVMTGNLFSISADQEIDGVEIAFEHRVDSHNGAQEVDIIRLVSSLGNGDDKSDATDIATETPTLRTYGGPTDLHGLALTPAVVNASSFGFELSLVTHDGNSHIAMIDYMQITVYYSQIYEAQQPMRMII